jgi:UDP-2,3-diacylglucosamine pyrophosphatase LpxH
MSPSPGETGYVLSDLHIFARSSLYERYLPTLEEAAASHRAVVLNGDTFDFKRSCFPSNDETCREASIWLSGLCLRHPETSFHYLLGNHDCIRPFVDSLRMIEKRCANLRVSEDTLKIGSNLFIHGDVCDLPKGENDLATLRRRYEAVQRSAFSIAFAQVVTYSRLNSVEYLRHSRRVLAERLMEYLEAVHPEELASTERIYFGHTHVPFSDFHYRGISFFNTGSAVRGLRLAPLEFPLPT